MTRVAGSLWGLRGGRIERGHGSFADMSLEAVQKAAPQAGETAGGGAGICANEKAIAQKQPIAATTFGRMFKVAPLAARRIALQSKVAEAVAFADGDCAFPRN